MSVFDSTGKYYDLLYRDKDYAAEAQFLHQRFQDYVPDAGSILELGCGTGKLAAELAQSGYRIQGVDLSEAMLEKALARRSQLPSEVREQMQFSQGNVQSIRLDRTFDVVISIFHVVSYQSTQQALQDTFTTVKTHLKPGGIFLFDVWYGPAVLTAVPAVRVKRLEDDHITVTRIAEPVMYPNENWVDVCYEIFVRDKASQQIEAITETHRMRYFFEPEIRSLLAEAGLELVCAREWLSDREPGFGTWGVYFIGKA
jgi:SAM-dependent methyltransferase